MNNQIVTLETAQKIACIIAQATMYQKTNRKAIVKKLMSEQYPSLSYIFVGEVPSKGANGRCIDMKKAYRINYRCGYGPYNYAPCIEIEKQKTIV
jgi:hypothetical protein